MKNKFVYFWLTILVFIISGFAQNNSKLILNIGKFNPDLTNLPPFFINSIDEKEFSDLIFSTLLTKTPSNEIEEDLLLSISNTNRTEWILILKDHIYFHDDSIITSDDVKFSIETLKKIKSEKNIFYIKALDKITGIEIIEKRTLIITLSSDIPNFEEILTKIPIIPKHYYDKVKLEDTINALLNDTPVGTGPFAVESITPGEKITFSLFTKYYKSKPSINEINIHFYSSYDKILQDFYLGKIDYFEVPNYSIANELQKSGLKNYRIPRKERNIKILYFLALNNKSPLFRNSQIRSALNYCINKNELINTVSNKDFRNIEEALSFVPSNSPIFLDDLKPVRHLPERTLELFKKAGWNEEYTDRIIDFNGNKFSFDIILPENLLFLENALRVMQLNFNEIRIQGEFRLLPKSEFINMIENGNYHAAFMFSFYFHNDFNNSLKSFLTPKNDDFKYNILNINHQEILNNIERLIRIDDFNLKKPIFERVQMLMADEVTFIPLFFDIYKYYAVKIDKFSNYSETFDKWIKK